MADKVTYFAQTDYRGKRIKFGIKEPDRARHMYVIGKTGMGKSTLLENLAAQDIQNGEGICFIDPHGGSAELMLSYVPEHRIRDVIYFAPFDQEFPLALNVMEDIGRDKRALVASGLIGAFKKVWVDAWSPRMEYLLSNALLALLEYPGSTLLGVNRMFADKDYRAMVLAKVTDPSVRAFWFDEFAKYSDKFATEATAAIQNKVGQFAANPLIRNLVGQPVSTFDMRKIMDEKKIFIVNLSKGRIGEGNASLLGAMIVTKLYLAAMSRADTTPEVLKSLPPFYLYVDEFQSFANESFADILSEARKYKLCLTVAHQYIEQMSEEVRAAVFGNVGTMITFRVGAYDAEVLEKEFAPNFTAEDLVNLGFAQIYLKLMINGQGSAPFSATTSDKPPLPPQTYIDEVVAASREQFGRPRAIVEEEIRKWHEPVPPPPPDPNAPPPTRKFPPGMRPSAVGEGMSPVRQENAPYDRQGRPPRAPGADGQRPLQGFPQRPRTPYPSRREDIATPAALGGALRAAGVTRPSEALAPKPPTVGMAPWSAAYNDIPVVPAPPPTEPAFPNDIVESGAPTFVRPVVEIPRRPMMPVPQRPETPVATAERAPTPAPSPEPERHQPFAAAFSRAHEEVPSPIREERRVPEARRAVEPPPTFPSPRGDRRHDERRKHDDRRRDGPRRDGDRPAPRSLADKGMPGSFRPGASLASLKSDRKTNKGPSEGNLNELKSMLARATADATRRQSPSVVSSPTPLSASRPEAPEAPRAAMPASPTSPEEKKAPQFFPEKQGSSRPNEVPEDVLRNVLSE